MRRVQIAAKWWITALACLPSPLRADPMLGEAKAALSTAEGAAANPANAAVLGRSEVDMHANIFKNETLRIRYPGFKTVNESDSGLGLPTAVPSFIFKVSPNLGVGGFASPPLPITLPVEKKNIPIMVLGTLNFVDISALGKLNGAAAGTIGYQITDRLAMGLSFNYLSISAEATLTPSEGGAPLAEILVTDSSLTAGAGLRFEVVPGRLVLGFASDIINQASTDLSISSDLMPAASKPKNTFSVVNPADAFLFGIAAVVGRSIKIFADIEYNRAAAGTVDFSFVDLTEKKVDLHDTLAVRIGALVRTEPTREYMAGFRYEPASMGQGSAGPEGMIGFGTMDVIKVLVYGEDLRPFWQVAGGMKAHFGRERTHRGKRVGGYYRWTVAGGLSYQRASLGIDADGELPGAYLQTKINVPVSLTYRF